MVLSYNNPIKTTVLKELKGEIGMTEERYRIVIRCQACGEKYILRGKRNEQGEYETGFKRCVCGNEEHLDIDVSRE